MMSSLKSWRRTVPCAALLVVALGCNDDNNGTNTNVNPATGVDGGTRDAGGGGALDAGARDAGARDAGATDAGAGMDGGVTVNWTDATIAGFTSTVNTGEVLEGLVAASISRTSDVQRFAERMVRDHISAQDRQAVVLRRINVVPADNVVTNQARNEALNTLQRLETLSGHAFDVAYMKAQVDDHETVLTVLDRQLIPQAESKALETELRAYRRTIDAHLTLARQVQRSLANANDGGVADAGSTDAGAGDAGAAGGGDAGAGSLSDAQITAVTLAANAGEVAGGMVAVNKARDQQVQSFAKQMENDHSRAVLTQASAVLRPANIVPERNQLSIQVELAAVQEYNRLRGVPESQFDLSYMQGQVSAHQQVLGLIDSMLLPAAQDSRLTASLRALRNTVASHLQKARNIVARLQAGGDAGVGDAGAGDAGAGDGGSPTVYMH